MQPSSFPGDPRENRISILTTGGLFSETYPLVEMDGVLASHDILDGGAALLLVLGGHCI